MPLTNSTSAISARLLVTMLRSGVRWALIYRPDGNQSEAEAYAYGNTLVFPVYDGVFLLAMTEGTYANGQLDRYRSGLWAVQEVDPEDDDAIVEFITNMVAR